MSAASATWSAADNAACGAFALLCYVCNIRSYCTPMVVWFRTDPAQLFSGGDLFGKCCRPYSERCLHPWNYFLSVRHHFQCVYLGVGRLADYVDKYPTPLEPKQGKGHSSANVTHRSIQGFRSLLPPATEGKLGAEFTVHHKEIIPTPSDSDSGRCFGANANRVFEVWGSTFSEEENESNVEPRTGRGREETLLGLAKVSLGPFSAHLNRDCSAGSGIDEPEAAPLATAADGHVPIIDPFSGRAVGELNVFVALGLSSTLAGLSADGDHGSVDGTAAAVADHRGIAERVSAARFVQGVAQMTSALGCAGSVDEHGATKEESNDDDNSDEGSGAGGVNGRAALQLLDDSVSGEWE